MNVGAATARRYFAIFALHFVPSAECPLHKSREDGEMRSILHDKRYVHGDSRIGNPFFERTTPTTEVEGLGDQPRRDAEGIERPFRH